MARTHTKALPKKLSKLITVALDDLNKIERLKGYSVDMGTWHEQFIGSNDCNVCLAGAVMSQTLKAHHDADMMPWSYLPATEMRLEAIDSARVGQIEEALNYLGHPNAYDLGCAFDRDIPEYEEDRRGFKLAMRKLSRDLNAARL